jgi:LysM repeat protein
MKTIAIALLVAVIVAGQMLTPAAAKSPTAPALTSSCGDTYTVQHGDYLSKIASMCGVPLSTILAYNPQITNPNRIYPGQVIYLTSTNPNPGVPPTGGTYVVQPGDTLALIAYRYHTTVSAILAVNPQITNPNVIYVGQVINLPSGTSGGGSYPGVYPYVTLSTTSVPPGGTFTVSASYFPANADIDYRVGKSGQSYSFIVDGKTNSSGFASASITIPSSAIAGEHWVVVVQTTSLPSSQSVAVTSPTIYISGSGSYPPGAYPYVTVSTTSVSPGGSLTVSANYFPANAEIDFRIGKSGQEYTAVVDSKTNSSGYASATVTIPSSAVAGEQWVVVVQTTSLPANQSVTVSSPTIYIK